MPAHDIPAVHSRFCPLAVKAGSADDNLDRRPAMAAPTVPPTLRCAAAAQPDIPVSNGAAAPAAYAAGCTPHKHQQAGKTAQYAAGWPAGPPPKWHRPPCCEPPAL